MPQWAQDDWQGVDVAKMLGGRRGVIDAATPGIVLVIIDAFTSLAWAIGGALIAAACIAILRLLRHEPLRQAGAGVLGLAGAAALAAYTGSAKTYFLPGILVNAAWAVAAITSILVGRPLLGYAAAMLDRGYAHGEPVRSTPPRSGPGPTRRRPAPAEPRAHIGRPTLPARHSSAAPPSWSSSAWAYRCGVSPSA